MNLGTYTSYMLVDGRFNHATVMMYLKGYFTLFFWGGGVILSSIQAFVNTPDSF